jgi:DNA-binding transcriptional MerR regulator
VRYRIEELAERSGVTVDTVRFYQTRGLLPRPERDGRVAWYDDGHLERLERVRDLKARGFPLAIIARLLAGELDPQEEALAVALTEALPGDDVLSEAEERLSLAELSERTGVSPTLLEALEREGLLVGRVEGDRPYTAADARVITSGLSLLETGVPLSELLALAHEHDEAMRAVVDRAVELFVRYVRDPLRLTAGSDPDASERAVEALHVMLPAVDTLVGHHFRRRLLAAARERIARPDAAAHTPEEAAS